MRAEHQLLQLSLWESLSGLKVLARGGAIGYCDNAWAVSYRDSIGDNVAMAAKID